MTDATRTIRELDNIQCPQCGEPTETLHEGYCAECCNANQSAVDQHNAQYDRWQGLSDRQRGDDIFRAILGETR